MENLGWFTIGLTLGAYLVDWFKSREIKQLEEENERLIKELNKD